MKKPNTTCIEDGVRYLLECLKKDDYRDSWHCTEDKAFDINVYYDEGANLKLPKVSLYEINHDVPEGEYPETGTSDWYTIPKSKYTKEVLDLWKEINKKYRKPRTKKELLADPRVQQLDAKRYPQISRILWNEGEDGWWCVLADGWNFHGCSFIHEDTIKDLCNALGQVTKGDPY